MGRFGIVHTEPEKEQVRYCLQCLENDQYKILGPRVIMPGKQRDPDYDNWLQCLYCGTIFAKYETKIESKIQDFVEISDNPHDRGKSMTGFKNKRRGKKEVKSRLARHKERIKKQVIKLENRGDSEIANEIKKGNTVRILEGIDLREGKKRGKNYHGGV